MIGRPCIIERAIQLAATGGFRTVTEIKHVLKGEGYLQRDAALEGAAIRKQLRGLMLAASRAEIAENWHGTDREPVSSAGVPMAIGHRGSAASPQWRRAAPPIS